MAAKRNFVFILTDDQGEWALHCAGNDDIITPNLDRLANMGARFTDFFCASPVCSPARASIITGEMPSCHGVLDWLSGGNVNTKDYPHMKEHPYFKKEDRAIEYLEGHDTYVKRLAGAGYRCALSGKWHLGNSVRPKEGFEKWYTIGHGGCNYFNPDICEDGKFYNENRYVTDLITERALDFLGEYVEQEAPWYLSIHYTAPHSPWTRENHKEEFLKLYDDCAFTSMPDEAVHPNQVGTCPVGSTPEKRKEILTGYFAAVTAMDEGIGRILDKLEESGQLENTTIIFTADNGMNMGHHGIWGKGNGTFPPNMYDSSVKVPFLIYDPQYFTGGKVIRRMAGHCDLFPTLLELAGIDYKVHDKQPGRNICSYGEHPEQEEDRDVVMCDEYGKVRMIRSPRYKYVRYYETGEEQFFDLSADPGERENRVGMPEYREEITELRSRMEAFFEQYGDGENNGILYQVTGNGQLKRCSDPGAFDPGVTYFNENGKHSFS